MEFAPLSHIVSLQNCILSSVFYVEYIIIKTYPGGQTMKKHLTLSVFVSVLMALGISGQEAGQFPRLLEQLYTLTLEQEGLPPALLTDIRQSAFNFANQGIMADNMGEVVERLYEEWDNGAWVYQEKSIMYLDNNGAIYEQLDLVWENNAWQNSLKSMYTNNSSGMPVESLHQMWESGSGTWIDFMKTFWTYNASGYPTEILMQINIGAGWMNMMKMTWIYNAQWLITETLTMEWDTVNNVWVNDGKSTFTYNASNWLTEELNQEWENNAWVNFELYSYTYDAGGHKTEMLIEMWMGGAWMNENLHLFTYNAQWLNTVELVQYWSTNTWINNFQILFTYDAQDRIIEELEQQWVTKGWEDYSRSTWSYLTTDIGESDPGSQLSFSLIPNPSKGIVRFTCSMAAPGGVTVRIFNVLGMIQETYPFGFREAGTYVETLDLAHLPQGVYLVNAEAPHGYLRTVRLLLAR